MIVSAVQFSIKPVQDEGDFWERVAGFVDAATTASSNLVIFPEYFSLSWLLLNKTGDFRKSLLESAGKEKEFCERFEKLAKEKKLTIVAGTHPHISNAEILNRSWIFSPYQEPVFQDKMNMTRFEAEEWKISEGEQKLQTFPVAGAKCAVAICYDVEFPSYCAAAAEAGVEFLAVPTCTDDVHGYWRVRHCAEARAVENQCYLATSSLVGGNSSWPEISYHYGAGTLITPSDLGFPEGGILASSRANVEEIVHGEFDLEKLRNIRKNGTVLNLRDSRSSKKIEIIS